MKMRSLDSSIKNFQRVDKETREERITVPSKDRECQEDGEKFGLTNSGRRNKDIPHLK